MVLTLNRFYQLMREAVMYYPLDQKVKPKTFGVIQHISDLNMDNLGKTFDDYDKGFFYSEQWSAAALHPDNIIWSYPIVCVDLFSGTVSDIEKKAPSITSNVTMRVLDAKDRQQDDLELRTYHEIEQDCSKIMMNVLRYFNDIIIATVDGVEDYYHEGFLVATGKTYTEIRKPNIFKRRGEPMYFNPSDTAIDNVIGKELRLDVITSVCTSDNWNFSEPVPNRKLACCG